MILRKIFVTDIMSPGIVLVPPVLVPPVTESELRQFSVTNLTIGTPKRIDIPTPESPSPSSNYTL